MKRAVVYGAGKIGRAFVGKKLIDSGYDVCFLDILPELVDLLNEKKRYTVRSIAIGDSSEAVVGPFRALYSLSPEAVEAIAGCDVLTTSVGANSLADIAPIIARAIALRMRNGGGPLNVLFCENQMQAGSLMRGYIYPHLTEDERRWADENIGLVDAVIGCTVPSPTPEMRAEDPLLLCVETYDMLPVNLDAIRGETPPISGLYPYSPFEYYVRRKLFLHNGGHALCAWLGYEKGYEYIWQASADPEILGAVQAHMRVCADALIARYSETVRADLERNIADLLPRFRNKALQDTVLRVGADPRRKLRRNDRVVGAALFAMEQGVDPSPIICGIAAGLRFDPDSDASARALRRDLREKGLPYVLENVMALRPDEPLYGLLLEKLR